VKKKGSAGLLPLLAKYPDDPAVLRAIALAYANEKKLELAIEHTKRLFAIAPAAVNDPKIRMVVLKAANSTEDASAPAFAMMSNDMGLVGPDLMYDLLTAPGVGPRPKEQAKAALAKAYKAASPALRIALDLRAASQCDRKALADRAKTEGDARSLHYLKPLLPTNSCRTGGLGGLFASSTDCHPCLGNRAEIREAIAGIERRMSAVPKSSK